MEIRALHGSDPEMGVTRELTQFRERHDLEGLEWTTLVVVDDTPSTVPHSHPVLTLSTRRRSWSLLATYLHEQLHWWLSDPALNEAFSGARAELGNHWTQVPPGEDEDSMYLHLIVCSLELRAVEAVAGTEVAQSLSETRVSGRVYPWVYQQVAEHQVWLSDLCDRLDLTPARLRDPKTRR